MRPKKVDMCASKEDCVFQWTRAGRVLPWSSSSFTLNQ